MPLQLHLLCLVCVRVPEDLPRSFLTCRNAGNACVVPHTPPPSLMDSRLCCPACKIDPSLSTARWGSLGKNRRVRVSASTVRKGLRGGSNRLGRALPWLRMSFAGLSVIAEDLVRYHLNPRVVYDGQYH